MASLENTNYRTDVTYVVIAKLPNLPVYRVTPERGTGIVKRVYRDHLLPISNLVRMPAQPERKAQPNKTMTKPHQAMCDTGKSTCESRRLVSDSEEEREGVVRLKCVSIVLGVNK